MPTNAWEPPPHQRDADRQPTGGRRDEPRNFETPRREDGANPDAPHDAERSHAAAEDINTHGSER
jgi:hypothetical protein